MARQGIGSYGRSASENGADLVRVECTFQAVRRDGSAICIRDGSEVQHPLFPDRKIPKEFWIPVKSILDSSYSSVHDLARGDKIEIFLTDWLATEKGLV